MDVFYVTNMRSVQNQTILSVMILSQEDAMRKKEIKEAINLETSLVRHDFREDLYPPNEEKDELLAREMKKRLMPLKREYGNIMGTEMEIPVLHNNFDIDEYYSLSDLKR